jgi:transposase
MANRLRMARIHTIVTLRAQGWSYRRIARELGIHRETVSRYLALAKARAAGAVSPTGSKPANALTGSGESCGLLSPRSPPASNAEPVAPGESVAGSLTDPLDGVPAAPAFCGVEPAGAADMPPAADAAKPANAPTGVFGEEWLDSASDPGSPMAAPPEGVGRNSDCEPLRDLIQAKLESGLSAVRIHQDLAAEHGVGVSYHSIRRFVARLQRTSALPFRRMECAPGEEAQVDFGTGAPILTPADLNDPRGKTRRRRTHVLRIVLSHSRKAYCEAVERQTTENFIRCLENAFHHFGGAPRTLVTDNLKAAVIRADWFDPELNPKIEAFCRHYGVVLLPAKPRMARHKGKIERGVGYVKGNGLKGRSFASLHDQNRHLLEWETRVADQRIHGTTRRQIQAMFEQAEKAALQPLPETRFPCFHEAERTVHRDGHVEVDKAYYSVPPEYLGRKVWVRWDGRLVRVFDQRFQQIALHTRRSPGHFATQEQHIAPQKRSGIERGAAWWLQKAHTIGSEAGLWAETLLQQRGIHGIRVLMGLVSLTRRHSHRAIEEACRITREQGVYRLRVLRRVIAERPTPSEEFEFTTEHPLIRSLSEYGQLVHDTFEELYMKNPYVAKHASASQAPTFSEGREGEPAPQVLPQTPSPWASFPSPEEAVGGLLHE